MIKPIFPHLFSLMKITFLIILNIKTRGKRINFSAKRKPDAKSENSFSKGFESAEKNIIAPKITPTSWKTLVSPSATAIFIPNTNTAEIIQNKMSVKATAAFPAPKLLLKSFNKSYTTPMHKPEAVAARNTTAWRQAWISII